MLGRSQRFLDITSTLGGGGEVNMSVQGHNTATRVGLEPPTSGSGVRGVNHQATALPGALVISLVFSHPAAARSQQNVE